MFCVAARWLATGRLASCDEADRLLGDQGSREASLRCPIMPCAVLRRPMPAAGRQQHPPPLSGWAAVHDHSLGIGSAVVPIQIVVTILLLQAPGGARTAAAWVAGMTTTRLVQGLLFGLVFQSSDEATSDSSGSGPVLSTILLVLAVLFYVTALKHLLRHEDADAPPPKWMTMTASMKPGKAFLIGAGYIAVSAKFWVFTLGAVGAIGDADLGRARSILDFLLFVALAELRALRSPRRDGHLANEIRRVAGPFVGLVGASESSDHDRPRSCLRHLVPDQSPQRSRRDLTLDLRARSGIQRSKIAPTRPLWARTR